MLQRIGLTFVSYSRHLLALRYSEWAMFALGWHWDRNMHPLRQFQTQMRKFKECSGRSTRPHLRPIGVFYSSTYRGLTFVTLLHRLFQNEDALRALSNAELFEYLGRCVRSKAMECAPHLLLIMTPSIT